MLVAALWDECPLPPWLPAPSSCKLWLADWGYNTEGERAAAAALPGVRLLSRPQFCELLKWGVVMEVGGWAGFVGLAGKGMLAPSTSAPTRGHAHLSSPTCLLCPPPPKPDLLLSRLQTQVDDGCEPTPEEVEAAARQP